MKSMRTPRCTGSAARLGGAARRVTNGSGDGQVLDVMVCPAKLCKYCVGNPMSQTMASRTILARAAENNASLQALQEASEKHTGKPFLHLLRDTDLLKGGRAGEPVAFSPRGTCTELTGETDKMNVVFDDGLILNGTLGVRSAIVCRPSSCSTCIQWSTITSSPLPMIHSSELDWDDDEDRLMWRSRTSVGIIEHESRLKQFGGPTVQVKVISPVKTFVADLVVYSETVCSYCSNLPPANAGKKAIAKAAKDACSKIDVDASPYILEGESQARPFVHGIRDTKVTSIGREFQPRGRFDDFHHALQPALILFDSGEGKSTSTGGNSKGFCLTSTCVFSECPTCQAWVEEHPEDAPQ